MNNFLTVHHTYFVLATVITSEFAFTG